MMQFSTRLFFFGLRFPLFITLTFLFSCKPDHADTLLINGAVHTMDGKNSIAQAVAIRDGKIVEVGSTDDLVFRYGVKETIDLEGRAVYPGFIDGHCHFVGYAKFLNQVDLVGTESFEQVLNLVDSFEKSLQPGEWLIGRGWDQNDWKENSFPTNSELNARYPDRPVILHRIDGHAALCNQVALDLAGISTQTNARGGAIGIANGQLTGILLDNAVDLVKEIIPDPDPKTFAKLLKQAEQNCFAAGLTTVDDAGLSLKDILFIDSLQRKGELKMRIYAMADPSEENLNYFIAKGPLKTDKLHVCSFKLYADGALGSRGACLLEPYKDDPNNSGFILQDETYYQDLAQRLFEAKFQVNTHCIGDSAVRMITRIYSNFLKKGDNRRWRIEHAQVVSPPDFLRFRNFDIIPSVQPTHAMSDYSWAKDRIGKERLTGAYAYKSLFEQNNLIAFGTDFPVENIDPLKTFFTAVTRETEDGKPFGGFMKEQALGRDTSLHAMTIWNAYANFEEKEKGSIEKGKLADIVVLDKDILYVSREELLSTKVFMTLSGGKIVYRAGK